MFVVNITDEKTFLETTSADIENKSISDILGFKTRETAKDQTAGRPTPETLAASPNEPTFWYWTPAHLNERITAQHSLFLFGLPSSGKLNSEELIIESESKEQIRKDLEDLQDIREESLFPDFVGFAYTQRYNAPYPTSDVEEYFRRGVEAQQRGQYSEAIENFTKAIGLNPEDAEAFYLRGSTYYSKSEYDHAIEDFTKAIELKSDYAEAYAFRGGIYNIQGDYDRAIQDSTKTIDLNPDYAEAYAIRGMAYCSQGDYGCAIQDLTKTIDLNPDYAEAHFTRAIAWLHSEKWKKAKSDLILAKNMGLDIVDLFSQYTENVANSEQNTEIKLPKYIAAMLTKSEN